MLSLPQEFLHKMAGLLGEDYPAFCGEPGGNELPGPAHQHSASLSGRFPFTVSLGSDAHSLVQHRFLLQRIRPPW